MPHPHKKHHRKVKDVRKVSRYPRIVCPNRTVRFNALEVNDLTVHRHLEVKGTSTFRGPVEANLITPVDIKPLFAPAVVLEPDNIKIRGLAVSSRNYGPADAIISGRVATILLEKLSGLYHYIEVSDFVAGGVPTVDKIIAVLPQVTDQPSGYTARVFRRQRAEVARAISLSVRTQGVQVFTGITFSTEIEALEERLHLRGIPVPMEIRSLVSQDTAIEVNAKPASHLDLALDDVSKHLTTNGRSFALEFI